MPAPWPEATEESEAKRPRVSEVTSKSRQCRRSIQSAGGLAWSSADLALAATLLETPNARFPTVSFTGLEEKRRVFTLIYDVLRYKSILNEALDDLYFFTKHPHLKERCHLVWLLFLDMYKRDFALRDPLEPEVEAAFTQRGLHEIDALLWQLRVKLAATVSRLRIKSGARSLSSLLPRHLQLTRTALEENIITGWVNIFKTNLKETCEYLESLGIIPLSRDRDAIEPFTFKTDHLLPRFLHIMPGLREDLVESPLLLEHQLIMQERTFCLGPAVMAQLLKDYALSGKVVQTHVNSPITMAYFANLLVNNPKIESLLVFGAGYRKEACEQYLRDLGVKNTLVYAESFAGLSSESRVLDNVIAVLATPPNTNSSVLDPVDLAVARGGDLQILQQLTADDFSSTPRGDHINKLLCDQRDTVRRAMSKPQIQFIVYETHSRFTCENEEMVSNLVTDLNNYAAEVHMEELRKAQGETQEREKSSAEASEPPPEVPVIRVDEDLTLPMPTPIQTLVIPPSDLFELADLPDLCPNFENCLDLVAEGTYVAVIKRKEITRLDPKYMIQMAEARGLFGRPDGTPKTKTSGQTARAKAALAALQARSDSASDRSKAKVKVEMDRIAAPTRASLLRDVHAPSSKDCPRYAHHLAHDGTPSYFRYCPDERKAFLTLAEEEELIRRLYSCPKVNVFPPRLYEDLPPLKFWNSPASVIEKYLQRKVFQRRLQLAYEFNQQKESHLHATESLPQEAPEQLTRAMMQLSADINYFEYLARQDTLRRTHDTAGRPDGYDQSKPLQDEIYSQVSKRGNVSPAEEVQSIENKTHKTLLNDIKNRYFNYEGFYRLKHLRTDNRRALASTIGIPSNHSFIKSPGAAVVPSVSFVESQDTKSYHTQMTQETKSGLIKLDYDFNFKSPHKESLHSIRRLPKARHSSLDLFNETIGFQHTADMEHGHKKLLQDISKTSISQDKKNTMITLRDSLLLAQERLSKFSRISLSRNFKIPKTSHLTIASHKDSYTMLMNKHYERKDSVAALSRISESSVQSNILNKRALESFRQFFKVNENHVNEERSTFEGHRDSMGLTLDWLSCKEKISKETSCDVCSNRKGTTIQFRCSLHTNYYKPTASIISKTSFLSHRDSVEIALNKPCKHINKKSIACQAEESDLPNNNKAIKEEAQPNNKLFNKLASGLKGCQKSVKDDESRKTDGVKITPSKLNNYLMSSIQITEIKINEYDKPI